MDKKHFIYDKFDDKILKKEFINKNKILSKITEEDIFELVFKFKPKEFEYVTSPFREDNNPGCWFERDINNRLIFKDFANSDIVNEVRMNSIDCFSAVKVFYNFTNFFQVLDFIDKKLIQGKNLDNKINVNNSYTPVFQRKKSIPTKIFIEVKDFSIQSKIYWNSYNISLKQLLSDRVYEIKRFKILSRKGSFTVFTPDISFAYTDFKNGRKKIYRPYQNKKKRKFITNCSRNDIGGINSLIYAGRKLIITKSYKDYRVLKNLGLNVIWFQNEGMFPDDILLKNIISRFDETVIIFDNDKTGYKASEKLKCKLQNLNINKQIGRFFMPKTDSITDSSDFVKNYNTVTFKKYLINNKIL